MTYKTKTTSFFQRWDSSDLKYEKKHMKMVKYLHGKKALKEGKC